MAVPGTRTAVVATRWGVVRLSVIRHLLALGVLQRAVVSFGAAGRAVAEAARAHRCRQGADRRPQHPLQSVVEVATGPVVELSQALGQCLVAGTDHTLCDSLSVVGDEVGACCLLPERDATVTVVTAEGAALASEDVGW